MQTERDSICQVIYQRLQPIQVYSREGISRESFAQSGYARLSFATALLSALGVTAKNSDIECTLLQSISASIIFSYSLFQLV